MDKAHEEKIRELANQFKSFQKTKYCKADVEGEMRKLQLEFLRLVFDEEHILNANLIIWDVYNQLEYENREKGGIATDELKEFKLGCVKFSNLIKAEISGNWGENQVFGRLSCLKSKNKILRNVELENGDNRTELDMVVLTEKVQVIVEVKNTKKDVFIDEQGDFYRCGEYMNFDCNLKQKMDNREQLLNDAIAGTLSERDKEPKIIKLVVFTNKHIEVKNKCEDLKVCFLGELPYYIDEFVGESIYSNEDIAALADAISVKAKSHEYELKMDMQKFKEDFVRLLDILENDEVQNAEEEVQKEAEKDFKTTQCLSEQDMKKTQSVKKYAGQVAGLLGAFGLGVIVTKVLSDRK